MAIEVRELIIRSSTSGKRASDDAPDGRVELEQFREEILEACRRMLKDQQRRERER